MISERPPFVRAGRRFRGVPFGYNSASDGSVVRTGAEIVRPRRVTSEGPAMGSDARRTKEKIDSEEAVDWLVGARERFPSLSFLPRKELKDAIMVVDVDATTILVLESMDRWVELDRRVAIVVVDKIVGEGWCGVRRRWFREKRASDFCLPLCLDLQR